MIVIHKYLVIAIQYDYPFTMFKYSVLGQERRRTS